MTVLALGFRPFYLLAAAFGACALPLWIAAWRGSVRIDSHLGAYAWHAHEMLFGFGGAVIAGFLLTAARNWTGRPTASGGGLGALVLLWLAARVLNLTGPSAPAALLDAAFLLLPGVEQLQRKLLEQCRILGQCSGVERRRVRAHAL